MFRISNGSSRPSKQQAGVTLVELMVVVAILAVLAALAVPAFSGDTSKSEWERATTQLIQDLQTAKFGAASSREDRALRLTAAGYTSESVVPGSTNFALRKRVALPPRVELKLNSCAALPGSVACGQSNPPGEVRFSGVGDLSACVGVSCAVTNSAATIWVKTKNGKNCARVVIYQSTAYMRRYDRC